MTTLPQSQFAYPLATSTWGPEEREAIMRVVDSGMMTMGPRVKEFESGFAEWVGAKYCLMANSGSSANLLAVASQFFKKKNPLKAGDEVIVPAMSWSTTYFPLAQYGLTQVLVDVNRDTLNLDLDQLEKAITPKTRAIFAVNLLGNPIDYTRLNQIIAGKDIILLEDNCESMGAWVGSQKAGTFGAVGTHSTFFSHHMATMEGGLANTDDEELFHIMLCLRAHGWLRNLPEQNHVHNKTGDAFKDSFTFALPGYCLRPTEIQGALGTEQLKRLDGMVALRNKNAAQFQKRFGTRDEFSIQKETGTSSWFGFAMVLRDNAPWSRDEVVNALNAHKIECRPIVCGDFTQNPVFKHMPHRLHGKMTNAAHIHTHGIFVGNNPVDLTPCFDVLDKALASLPKSMKKAA